MNLTKRKQRRKFRNAGSSVTKEAYECQIRMKAKSAVLNNKIEQPRHLKTN